MNNRLITLGIESSCDETAAALVRGTDTVLASVVASQEDLHGKYGGVVPELACRRHAETIRQVVAQTFAQASLGWDDINLMAVTQGPGLVGALLVGLTYAKAAAIARKLPLVGVNHLAAHIEASFVEKPDTRLPMIALLVSGGHSELYYVKTRGSFLRLGGTRDDAAGEAFDKVAKLLGLGYPGGPLVQQAAVGCDPRFPVPIALKKSDDFDFSFSGPKTAVKRIAEQEGNDDPQTVGAICASFQNAVVEALVLKTERAINAYRPESLVIGGGVACNGPLRERMRKLGSHYGIDVVIPAAAYCADNAVMIAAAGAFRYLADPTNPAWQDFTSLDAIPNWHP
jgi:N6-L-threonylcarbamoyladenine synthase